MIFWLCGSLPWEKLVDQVAVQKEKEKAFGDIDNFLNKCFNESVPQAIHKFMTLLNKMKFNEIPCYEKFKDILITSLKKLGHKPDGKLGLKSMTIQQNSIRSTPKKVKQLVDKVRKSPRLKPLAAPSNSLRNNPRESTIGVVIDKKRGNKQDIKKVLEDIDPDGEYDIKIVHKTKKSESVDVSKAMKNATLLSTRKKMRVNYIDDGSENDSTEVIIYLEKDCIHI